MRRAYKFLLRPTTRQAQSLAACLEDHRQLYNGALEHRRTAWRMAGVTVRYGDQSAELKDIPPRRPRRPGPLVVLLAAGHPAPPGQGVPSVLPSPQGR